MAPTNGGAGGDGGGKYSSVATNDNGRADGFGFGLGKAKKKGGSQNRPVEQSPFFQPSDPRKLRPVSTPGGTVKMEKKQIDAEHKSSILGASANLVVSIVGAGIVGIPYSLNEAGLVAGLFMVIFCALLTEKSLRLLIDTAKHIDVPSYETLYEASFGYPGFVAMSVIMFTMSYGAMVSYLMIMKDTLATLIGIPDDDRVMRRTVLIVTTACILFPLSSQRDMADLAKTSKLSVTFYILIVTFVAVFSPIGTTLAENGGLQVTVSENIIKPATFFTGLGVLSFAYVCQHSAYIIAGSLERPTRSRWATVTGLSLLFCGVLASVIGVTGYLGFLDATEGNVLNNFEHMADATPLVRRLTYYARAVLLLCMFFVYPMDAFVSRHVLVVLLFKGRSAHEGDDHAVLARTDRRVLLTLFMYIVTLLPAVILNDLGSVLAVTGAIAGSFLSYIAPGSAYLAVHGGEFATLVGGGQRWKGLLGAFLWYVTLMPLWMAIAGIGQRKLEQHYAKEALKSPHLSRLGKVKHNKKKNLPYKVTPRANVMPPPGLAAQREVDGNASDDEGDPRSRPPVRMNSLTDLPEIETTATGALRLSRATDDGGLAVSAGYGSIPPGAAAVGGGNRGIAAALAKKNVANSASGNDIDDADVVEEDDPQEDNPKVYDFLVAIFYMMFGFVAMVVGLWSIFET